MCGAPAEGEAVGLYCLAPAVAPSLAALGMAVFAAAQDVVWRGALLLGRQVAAPDKMVVLGRQVAAWD